MSALCDDLRMSILRSALNGDLSASEEEWNECKLEDLCEEITTGGAAPQGEKNFCNDGPCFVRVVDMGKLGVNKMMHETRDHLSKNGIGKLKLFPAGTILFTKSGASLLLNQRAILEKSMYVVSHIGCAVPKSIVSSDFLYLILKGIDFNEYAHATSLPSLKMSDLKKVTVKYPSLQQQKIIVEKVDELMARVADLEQSADALASLKKAFPNDIKASLLQAAIQGKLTEQLPEDGNAEELLEQIKVEKEKLVAEGKIKKQKPLAPITDDKIPFSIPENWKWVRWGDIINIVSARRVHQSDWKKNGIPFYRAREIGKLADYDSVDNDLFVSQELFNEYSKSGLPKKNDLMVTAVGTLGKTYVVKESDKFYYKDASVLCFENYHCDPFFLKYLMSSDIMKSQIESNSGGTTVGTLTIVRMNDYILPLPPLDEQKRIVERLNILIQNINVVGELIASE